MPAPISREYRIYLALWRKAIVSDQPVTIKASNYAMAIAMRQGMYRAIRPFRHNLIQDIQLREAAEKYVLYLIKGVTKSDPHFIEIRPRLTLVELEGMLDYMELVEDDLLIEDERIPESIKQLAESTKSKPKAKAEANKFYTRD